MRAQQAREADRARRARDRETRALEHQRQAERRADEVRDPEIALAKREEAAAHARAARIHHDAAEFQLSHAREAEQGKRGSADGPEESVNTPT